MRYEKCENGDELSACFHKATVSALSPPPPLHPPVLPSPRTIDKLDQSMEHERDATLEFDLSHSHRSGRHSTPSRDGGDPEPAQSLARRSRSLSPRRHRQDTAQRRLTAEQRLADTQRLLELKVKSM